MFPIEEFRSFLAQLQQTLQIQEGLWSLRGFIDTARCIYSLGPDTKVISKALELMLLPPIVRFWEDRGYQTILARYQNFYPDISLVKDNVRYALDLKSTYRIPSSTPPRVSGFTLGAFTGYFRDRSSTKNVTFPYGSYHQHYVIGVVYTQVKEAHPATYSLDELEHILPPIRDIEILCHEKWRIASDRPGSGNTRNIGSVTDLEALRRGEGPFARLGPAGARIFDEYWRQYMNRDMARAAELAGPPFRNLREYLQYRNRPDLLARLDED